MRVFMLGWEFPPFISGGLGTACYGLTKAMSALGTDILFVLPRPVSTPFSTHLRLVSPRLRVTGQGSINLAQRQLDYTVNPKIVGGVTAPGAVINVKHGQFIAPDNMIKPVQKIEASGNDRIILTERGYTFGYNDLIVDPRSFMLLGRIGYPVVFDITHTIRKYGIPSKDPRGGTRQYLSVIARAGGRLPKEKTHNRYVIPVSFKTD